MAHKNNSVQGCQASAKDLPNYVLKIAPEKLKLAL